MRNEMKVIMSIGSNDPEHTRRDFDAIINYVEENLYENSKFKFKVDDVIEFKTGGDEDEDGKK